MRVDDPQGQRRGSGPNSGGGSNSGGGPISAADVSPQPDIQHAGASRTRAFVVLIVTNLLGGVGVAASVAVGALLVERVGGTSLAGIGQALSVLGAAVAAVPLASLAASRGRRWSLGVGYLVAVSGAVVIIAGAITANLLLLLGGLALFGFAQATNLQSRYAATDTVDPARRARAMSIVIWATTIGVVAGPNLTAPADAVGARFGLPELAGPFLFSAVGFVLAGLVVVLGYPRLARIDRTPKERRVGALAALRWAAGDARARTGVVTVAGSHAVMVAVMVMTPLHMTHSGMGLELVGIVISLHTLGMYAFSPIFGWLADRWGRRSTAWLGAGILAAALVLTFVAGDSEGITLAALFLLGLGWSAGTISGSAMVAATEDVDLRIALQGATDATLSYAGAGAAALAGPVFAAAAFPGVGTIGAVVLAVVVVVLWMGRRQPHPRPWG